MQENRFEPVQLEILDDEAIGSEWNKSWLKQSARVDLDDETMEVLRDISQATIAHNEAKFGKSGGVRGSRGISLTHQSRLNRCNSGDKVNNE